MADVPMGIVSVPPITNATLERTVPGAYTLPGTIIGGEPAAPAAPVINRVWDVQAGPGFVRWETTDPDPTGTSYPGPGTFGVDTSDYCIEYRE